MTNRRKFLAGLGALASGSAAAMGTGAFTSVSANRDITVDVAGDASAFLQFTEAEEDGSVTPNAEEYVNIESDGTVAFDFTDTNESAGENATGGSGINDDATTIFDNLLDVTNQGTQEINIGVDLSTEPSELGIYAEDEQGVGNADDLGGGFAVRNYPEDPNWDHTLGVGETLENIGVYVTDPSAISGETTYTVTIIAERVGGNRD
jgi:hypothetical protein